MKSQTVKWVLVVVTLWLLVEQFLLGPFSYLLMSDLADHHVPMQIAAARDAFPGANWFSSLVAGTDAKSLGIMGPGDQILFRLLPDWLALIVLISGSAMIGTVFTYRVCRDTLKTTQEAAILAALIFVLSLTGGRLIYSMVALLPAVIWLTTRAMNLDSWWSFPSVVAVGLVFGAFSQAQMLLPWPFIFMLGWFVIVDPRKRSRDWLVFLLLVIAALGVRAPDFIGMASFSGISNRSVAYNSVETMVRLAGHDPFFIPFAPRFEMAIGSVFSTLTAFAPWTPFSLIAVVWFFRRDRSPMLRQFFLFSVLVIGVSIPAVVVKFAAIDILPFIRGVRPDRMLAFSPFVLALLAGLGVTQLSGIKKQLNVPKFGPIPAKAYSAVQIAFALGLALVLGTNLVTKVGHAEVWVRDGSFVRNFQSPVMQSFAEAHPLGTDPFRVASFQMHGAHAAAYGLETVDGKVTMVPNRYREYWGRVISRYLAKDDYKRELFWATSAGSVLSLFYENTSAQIIFSENYDLELLSLAGARYVFSRDELVDPNLTAIRTPDRPWNSLDTKEKIRVGIRENFTGRELLYIYENTSAFPRAFVVSGASFFEDKQALLDALIKAGTPDLRENVFFSNLDANSEVIGALGGAGDVEIRHYESDRIELEATTDAPALLVITNSFTKYWICEVNGVVTPIYPAYHAFWAVRLPADHSEITCQYSPPYAVF